MAAAIVMHKEMYGTAAKRELRSFAGPGERAVLYRFLDAGNTKAFRTRSRPASKKRRGTKSREEGHRRSSECYGISA